MRLLRAAPRAGAVEQPDVRGMRQSGRARSIRAALAGVRLPGPSLPARSGQARAPRRHRCPPRGGGPGATEHAAPPITAANLPPDGSSPAGQGVGLPVAGMRLRAGNRRSGGPRCTAARRQRPSRPAAKARPAQRGPPLIARQGASPRARGVGERAGAHSRTNGSPGLSPQDGTRGAAVAGTASSARGSHARPARRHRRKARGAGPATVERLRPAVGDAGLYSVAPLPAWGVTLLLGGRPPRAAHGADPPGP